MASSLTAFLAANAQKIDHNETVTVSERLRGEDGGPLKFTIREISAARFQQIQKDCTDIMRTKRVTKSELNTQRFNNCLILESLVDPDLHDKTLQEAYGVMTAEELLGELLNPGEFTDLLNAVTELNGFDMEELTKEAKN